ncbi:mannosyltransferase putative-domain-containing protein [Pilaira anomala]|nr:mannosyltransferase putative-domain-containing protein [Pilaira anomala]
MVAAERLFKSLFMYFDPIISQNADIDLSIKHEKSWELYQRLESTLYPWIYPYWKNAFHINNQTTGKGIVMCVGNDQFKFAISSIRAIREVLGCNLPIEIFFVRDDDLSMAKRSYLATEFSDIRLMKLEDSISKYYTRFGGWAMKPFAILASKFTEVIMMDADVFFFQDPSLLLNDAGYKKTGSLFFYDRTLLPNWEKGPDWLRSFLPTMSSLVNETRWFRGTSSHEQESGVVVMNKKKSLLGLLSTCKLNALVERDEVVYKHVYGDKETYWVGHEISQTPYSFVKSFSAVIGDMGRGGDDGETTQVCGNQLHLDAEGIPLWLNGALYRDKSKTPLEYLNFTYYAEGDDWEFKTHCLKSQDKIYEFPSKQRDIALASVEINIQMLEDTRLVEEGKWNS